MQDIFEELLAGLSLEDLRAQKQRYADTLEVIENRIAALDALIRLKEPEARRGTERAPVRTVTRPSQPEAVMSVMESDPGRAWTRDEIMRELESRGWQPMSRTPLNSLAATLSKLAAANEVRRVARSTYKLPSPNGDAESAMALSGIEGQDEGGED